MTIQIQFNHEAFDELLKSPEVQEDLLRRARAIADASGIDCDVEVTVGERRARAHIATATPAAMLAERNHRSLTRAIDAGRG